MTPAGFLAKCEPEPNSGCWLWTGGWTDLDYGVVPRIDGERVAHRISWRLHRGPIPDGMKVLHRCDVRACANPDHLFLGTQMDNIADMVAKGRHRGAPQHGESNAMSKLTERQVIEIRDLHSRGISQHRIAQRYGVAVMTINRAVRRHTWVTT